MEGHHGCMKLCLGLVILANVYWLNLPWWTLIGWVLVISGALKWIMPGCCKAKAKK